MSKPRISVIMPNLNNGQFLERALCSVLDQGYENLEFYVIDGGSNDESLSILSLYENELTGWSSENDLGTAHAINKGLAKATGEIVAVVASDDLLLPGALESVARRMGHPAGPRWLVGRSLRIDADDQMLGRLEPTDPASFASFLMHDSGQYPISSTFWHRSLFDTQGKFDVGLHQAFDYEYCCRLQAAGHEATITDDIFAARREHAQSHSATHTLQRGLEYIATARRYASRLPLAQRYPLWLNCDYRERIYTLAQAELQGEHGREFLWQQLLRHPWWVVDQLLRHRLVHGTERSVGASVARPAA